MNVDEYKDRVAQIGCLVCIELGYGGTPATLHHPRAGQGAAQRADDWLVIPLCKEHHQGNDGIHNHGFVRKFKLTEMDLLARTIKTVMQGVR